MQKRFSCRKLGCFALAKLCLLLLMGCQPPASGSQTVTDGTTDDPVASSPADAERFEAVYQGVYGYGSEGVTAEDKDEFTYRFLVNGEEKRYFIDNGPKTEKGYAYPIQNALRIGSSYRIAVKDGTVVEAEALDTDDRPTAVPVASYLPGEKTLKNFLSAALAPMGSTLYVYGGGWNWQDDGSSAQSVTVGLSPSWSAFFDGHDGSYTYRGENGVSGVDYYPHGGWNEYYYAGLDCSGYVGWTLYNTLHTENGGEGYVMSSTQMASAFAEKGWGACTKDAEALRPGDVVSIQGHVWICLGTCADGSVVIAHSTPSDSRDGQPGGGVQLTALGPNESCEAYGLVDRYMSRYFPKWYERYPATLRSLEGYTNFTSEPTGCFSWSLAEGSLLADPDGIAEMTASEVLAILFGEAV